MSYLNQTNTKPMKTIHIVGGGLAGCEAAWQVLTRDPHAHVKLYEMRPQSMTPAHKTGHLAELVCSNSFKSEREGTAPGVLKKEMKALNSLILESAYKAKIPAGQALGVDRILLSESVEEQLEKFGPRFLRLDTTITEIPAAEDIPANESWIIATGPLTDSQLAESLDKICGEKRLHFYDAIAPVIAGDSIDMDVAFWGDRYGKGDSDYLNIPLDKEQYKEFVQAVAQADKVPLHAFESTKYFESCLPIEVMVERGENTLRFGPLKPVGFVDPKTDRRPYALIQLRQENQEKTMFSMVGFQTKMTWTAQKEVFSALPSLENAEFLRFGSVHRNTYVQGPEVLNPDLSLKAHPKVYLAGQITGVEGYGESAAMGLLAGRAALQNAQGKPLGERVRSIPPKNTMIGALIHYVTYGSQGAFQPMNTNLGLLPPYEGPKIPKADRKLKQCEKAWDVFEAFLASNLNSDPL